VLAPKIERGELQLFCPDAVDTESWYNKGVHPRVRVLRICSTSAISARVSAIYPVEESDAAVGGYGVQFRRIPRDEFFAEASGCGDALCDHERSVRYSPVSGWILRQRLLFQ